MSSEQTFLTSLFWAQTSDASNAVVLVAWSDVCQNSKQYGVDYRSKLRDRRQHFKTLQDSDVVGCISTASCRHAFFGRQTEAEKGLAHCKPIHLGVSSTKGTFGLQIQEINWKKHHTLWQVFLSVTMSNNRHTCITQELSSCYHFLWNISNISTPESFLPNNTCCVL